MNADDVVAFVGRVADGEDLTSTAESLELYGAKALRTACAKLNLRPQASSNVDGCSTKAGLVALLVGHIRARLDGAAAGSAGPTKATTTDTPMRITKNCAFRLLNVLFSDGFSSRLQEVNSAGTRRSIEGGAVNDGAVFWRDVADAYASKDSELDCLVASRSLYDDVKPGAVVTHKPSKLRKLWHKLSARYTLAYTRAHQSGTHESDFFDFCDGRLDTLYLHDWLKVKPQLLSQVDGRIPESARVDSLKRKESARESTDSEATPSKRARVTRSPKVLERIVNVLEANASRRATSDLHAVCDTVRSATQVLEMIAALKAAGGDDSVIAELQREANEMAKETVARLRTRRKSQSKGI